MTSPWESAGLPGLPSQRRRGVGRIPRHSPQVPVGQTPSLLCHASCVLILSAAGALQTCRLKEAASTTVMSSGVPSSAVSRVERPYLSNKGDGSAAPPGQGQQVPPFTSSREGGGLVVTQGRTAKLFPAFTEVFQQGPGPTEHEQTKRAGAGLSLGLSLSTFRHF